MKELDPVDTGEAAVKGFGNALKNGQGLNADRSTGTYGNQSEMDRYRRPLERGLHGESQPRIRIFPNEPPTNERREIVLPESGRSQFPVNFVAPSHHAGYDWTTNAHAPQLYSAL